MAMQSFKTVDDYINSHPDDTKKVLQELRTLIHKIAPNATEDMSYKMPSFKLHGKPLIYFAAWKEHISLYPTPNGMDAFEKELGPYKSGKGTAQFSLTKPIPFNLIKKIVRFRAKTITNTK